ncbi:unnamed protein product [Nezara viridula]|uniref:Uncharacterized protein n=1 Tax=Nezara viridula TaxID=85310 RepID=A0A9P0E7C9_NEZVI|nr:unnamed protein product [Nezara viridula]
MVADEILVPESKVLTVFSSLADSYEIDLQLKKKGAIRR